MAVRPLKALPFLLPNREHWVITRDKGLMHQKVLEFSITLRRLLKQHVA